MSEPQKMPLRRKLLFALIGIITIIVLIFSIENFRGKRAWDRYAAALPDQERYLTFKAHIPPEIPDAENFAGTPFFNDLFKPGANGAPENPRWPSLPKRPSSPGTNFLDLPAYAIAFDSTLENTNSMSRVEAATNLLSSLKVYDSVLDELRSVAARPKSRYAIDYNTGSPFSILLPHLQAIRDVCIVLQIKAIAEQAAGNHDQAFEDLKLSLRISDSLDANSFLIEYLVRVACLMIATPIVQEGIAAHTWTDAQLKEIQEHISSYDFKNALSGCLLTERAGCNETFTMIRNKSNPSDPLLNGPNFTGKALSMMPRGWLWMEQLNYNRIYDTYIDRHAADYPIDPAVLKETQKGLENTLKTSPIKAVFQHKIFASLLVPAISSVYAKSAHIQAHMSQAIIACALERYYLKTGQYPKSLEELVPEQLTELPLDPILGGPMQYQVNDDGSFHLYSIGWDGTDSKGLFAESTKKEGDWVWRYPRK